jgi:phosphatidylglycerophosphate synthase
LVNSRWTLFIPAITLRKIEHVAGADPLISLRRVRKRMGAGGMKRLAALVLDEGASNRVAGLTLAERAVLQAVRAGFDPVYVWSTGKPDAAASARLQARGVAPLQLRADSAPLEGTRSDEAVVVFGSNVLVGPALLAALAKAGAERNKDEATAASNAGTPLLIHVPPETRTAVLSCRSIESMAASLAARQALRELQVEGMFGRRVTRADNIRELEREYIRHLTGKGESYFTKKIRRFSVPLTTWLVHFDARPTQVTLGGLALAVASAWCLAQGDYVVGLLGALLYYTSMIFDCSDGEVARVTEREGSFGAWLETIVDYVTYFLILAAVATASQSRPHAESYRIAAWTALVGSVIVALVAGYLRHRVAAADPGHFDDASAKVMASSTRFHRFARWGRQWIKRSSLAHIIVALALVNQLPALLYLWAFGATVASVVILVVEPFIVRRVAVAPAGGHAHG